MSAGNDQTRPVPIRLAPEIRGRLDTAAKRLASNRSAVIRLAIFQMLPEIESGHLVLRVNPEEK